MLVPGEYSVTWCYPWLQIVVALIMVIPSMFPQAMTDGSGSCPAPEMRDWTVINATVFTGEVILQTGNLTVGSGGDLTLESYELRMNLLAEGGLRIRVDEGGALRGLNNSVLDLWTQTGYATCAMRQMGQRIIDGDRLPVELFFVILHRALDTLIGVVRDIIVNGNLSKGDLEGMDFRREWGVRNVMRSPSTGLNRWSLMELIQ